MTFNSDRFKAFYRGEYLDERTMHLRPDGTVWEDDGYGRFNKIDAIVLRSTGYGDMNDKEMFEGDSVVCEVETTFGHEEHTGVIEYCGMFGNYIVDFGSVGIPIADERLSGFTIVERDKQQQEEIEEISLITAGPAKNDTVHKEVGVNKAGRSVRNAGMDRCDEYYVRTELLDPQPPAMAHAFERALDPFHSDAFVDIPEVAARIIPTDVPRTDVWCALDYYGNAIGVLDIPLDKDNAEIVLIDHKWYWAWE